MVPITKELQIAENPDLVVHSAEGEYADSDLILCARRDNPSLPVAQMQAQYVKYGPVVYQFNTPEELGAALFVLDPESSHDAVLLYKEEVARKAAREKGTLEPSDPVPAPDSNVSQVPEEEEDDVKFFREQAAEEASSTPATTEESVPEMPVIEADPSVEELPVVEPEVIAPDNISTTTPALPEEAVDLSTTTPE